MRKPTDHFPLHMSNDARLYPPPFRQTKQNTNKGLIKKLSALALVVAACAYAPHTGFMTAGMAISGFINTAQADEIPILSPNKPIAATSQPQGHTLNLAHASPMISSGMQVYLSPATGKPIPFEHPDRVSQVLPPLRALHGTQPSQDASTEKSPLAVLTSAKEKGGKFVITGPHFRSHMRAEMVEDKAVAMCTLPNELADKALKTVAHQHNHRGHHH